MGILGGILALLAFIVRRLAILLFRLRLWIIRPEAGLREDRLPRSREGREANA